MADNLAKSFDDMSVSEQIAHVQDLWDRIAERQDRVPVPEWHRAELQRRVERLDRGEAPLTEASDVFARLRARHS